MLKIQPKRKTDLLIFFSSVVLLATSGCTTNIKAKTEVASCLQENSAIVSYQKTIDSTDPRIAEALKAFPKGGDIHNHLSGSIMPEDFIAMGVVDGYCFDPSTYTITKSCSADTKHLSEASQADTENLKKSLSMYQFPYADSGMDIQGGHDHFFSTFGKFGAVSGTNQGQMFAKLLMQAAEDNVTYVETMMSFGHDDYDSLYATLTKAYPNSADYNNPEKYQGMLAVLQKNGLPTTITEAKRQIDQYEQIAKNILGCEQAAPSAACHVKYRIQGEVNRNPKAPLGLSRVFIQAAINFELAKADERVVGTNLVSGEDLTTSMEGFDSQMQIFSFFNKAYPDVNIALHAGELTPCFVGKNNPALFDHLTGSINAGAKRIGHGVSFEYLTDEQKEAIATQMKEKNVLVEVPMTSNAQILGVTGSEHPFPLYFRHYSVPAAFATDDEGVSYNNFTNEWIYAYSAYNLSYDELLTLSRNSLQYSFLSGDPLWDNYPSGEINGQCAKDKLGILPQSDDCKDFLKGSDKAALQWKHEIELNTFSKKYKEIFTNTFLHTASQ